MSELNRATKEEVKKHFTSEEWDEWAEFWYHAGAAQTGPENMRKNRDINIRASRLAFVANVVSMIDNAFADQVKLEPAGGGEPMEMGASRGFIGFQVYETGDISFRQGGTIPSSMEMSGALELVRFLHNQSLWRVDDPSSGRGNGARVGDDGTAAIVSPNVEDEVEAVLQVDRENAENAWKGLRAMCEALTTLYPEIFEGEMIETAAFPGGAASTYTALDLLNGLKSRAAFKSQGRE